eukprot:TRINITY_DN65211_c0_g1_i1.p1 TRINITY_DN65211_c0_g1~~TRINITY_DN65211_c0_g1_i1.p1  ORF type:complete len:670 (+),score=34.24 TRINITY_DN65211_c0_g1_i1:75-2084(+)
MRLPCLLFVGLVAVVTSQTFGPCPYDSLIPNSKKLLYAIDCITIPVPLDPLVPAGSQINFVLTRIRPAAVIPIQAQVWVLNELGEPGNALLDTFTPSTPLEFEFILPDHRGTGYSNELACPDTTQNTASTQCLQWARSNADTGTQLRHYTIANAAADLKAAIDLVPRVAGRRLVLHGLGYGTLWAQRFLQLHPNVVQAVTLDGPLNPVTYNLADPDGAYLDPTAKRMYARCDAAPACKATFTSRGFATTESAVMKVLNDWRVGSDNCIRTHFPQFNTRAHAERVSTLHYIWMDDPQFYWHRVLLAGVFARLVNCGASDVVALDRFFNQIQISNLTAAPFTVKDNAIQQTRTSLVLAKNIQLSDEIYPPTPGAAVPSAVQLRQLDLNRITTGEGAANAELRERGFPVYPASASARGHVPTTTTTRVFQLGGDYDPAAIVSQSQSLASTQPSWFSSVFPVGPHLATYLPRAGITCAFDVFIQFWTDSSVDPTTRKTCWNSQLTDFDWNLANDRTRNAAVQHFGVSALFPITVANVIPAPPAAPTAAAVVTSDDDNDNDNDNDVDDDHSAMSSSAIVGVVIGAVLGCLILLCCLAALLYFMKKSKRPVNYNKQLAYSQHTTYPPVYTSPPISPTLVAAQSVVMAPGPPMVAPPSPTSILVPYDNPKTYGYAQ